MLNKQESLRKSLFFSTKFIRLAHQQQFQYFSQQTAAVVREKSPVTTFDGLVDTFEKIEI